MARSVEEWIGRTDDARIPPRVRDRIFERDGHVCHICKLVIKAPGETWDADHVKALINGGEHRETNLAPAHKHCHIGKSAVDAKIKAKSARVRKKHVGITQPAGNIQSPGFAKTSKPAKASRWDFLPALPKSGIAFEPKEKSR